MGKTLDVSSYKVRLKLDFKIDGYSVEFKFNGQIDIIFNSKFEICDIPFCIDSKNGRPRLEYFYEVEKKFVRHIDIIKSNFFPFLTCCIDSIFNEEIENLYKNIGFTKEYYEFEGEMEE